MIAPVIQISSLTTVRRHRELPVPGNVVVRQGQKVEARDVIAEARLVPEHILLDVARSLNVSPQKADDLIQRAARENVSQGDLIAGPVGFPQRVVRSPRDGRIVVAGDGQVLLEVNTPPFEIRAGMPGTVTKLIPDRGAVIETNGALVQGVWYNGRAEYGLLQSKLEAPDDQLTSEHLDVSLRGAIVLGGYCADPAVLHQAVEIPLRGLIFASMDSALIPLALSLRLPVLVLEGFGFHALNTMSYNVLVSNHGREVAVNATAFDRYHGTRPEVVIPLDVDAPLEDEAAMVEDFAVGQKVRLVRAPHFGEIGTIAALPAMPVSFQGGLRAPGAEVVLDGERLIVPMVNLERVI